MVYTLTAQHFIGLIIVLCLAERGNACARMSDGGAPPPSNEPPPSSPSEEPTEQCPPVQGQVALYEDNSFTIGSSFYGQVPPTSTCVTCATGSTRYYPDSGTAVPRAVDERAIGGITCQNYCLCRADGVCFQRSSPTSNVVLYPYCDGGVCSTYVVVLNENDGGGIISTDGSILITGESQIDPVTIDNYPVTQGDLYPKVTSVSCNGCDFAKSC